MPDALLYIRGSIPALAGERSLGTLPFPENKVYPRACGGTSTVRAGYVRKPGLSPRLRGNGAPSR